MSEIEQSAKAGLVPATLCTRRVMGNEAPGSVCVDCGHNTLVHGGFINPELDGCALCELEAVLADARAAVADLRRAGGAQ